MKFNRDKLQKVLDESGESIAGFAERANLHQNTIRYLLHGKRYDPASSTLAKFAEITGLPMEYFMDDCAERTSPTQEAPDA